MLSNHLKLNPEEIEKEINQQNILHGGLTLDSALASFYLALYTKSPEDIANYITHNFEKLSKYLNVHMMRFIQIQCYAQAGRSERAKEFLKISMEEGLLEQEVKRLEIIIASNEGANPTDDLINQFDKTDSLVDLNALVDELETREKWDTLCDYGEILFKRTHSLSEAERLANALSHVQQNERLIEFLEANPDLVAQSKALLMFYCWSLYYEGRLLEAREELRKMDDDPNNPNYRSLQKGIGITLGDWGSLFRFVESEFKEKENRSAQELISAAQLALHLDSPYAKDLTFAAAAKGNEDADILIASYVIASSADWEDNENVSKWLHKAVELSGEDGPIKKMDLKDLLAQKPEWDQRESEIWKLLGRGEIPLFRAAQSLNKSLIDLMLISSLANLSASDPRHRRPISAYSGKRKPTQLRAGWAVGIDATALLTLSFLDLLDKVFDAFPTLYVPHSTLAWLFEEKQKASFHQPSRIRQAHHLRNLLEANKLEKFSPSTTADSDLSAQVGDNLAMLIAEAEKTGGIDDIQRIVVRPSPVHRISSLMEEEADLSAHPGVMCGCLPVVEKLREKGEITATEEARARAYLQLQERSWPNQPELADGAVLYLDDTAVSCFLHLGMLEKLKSAGFRAIVSPGEVSEINALITYESISEKVNDAIERIRSSVSSRIESGKIKVGRQINVDDLGNQSTYEQTIRGVIALGSVCDAVITDDRFLNEHENIEDKGNQTPLFSTLDLLDTMASVGSVTLDDLFEYRTKLRRAGYFFISADEEEMTKYIAASMIKDNKVCETAELKAIRENILHVRMSSWLMVPKEELWLNTILKVFIRTLRGLWKDDEILSDVIVRSNWIVDQIDVRGWAHCIGIEEGDNIIESGWLMPALTLLWPLFDVSEAINNAYWAWVEKTVLAPIKEQCPNLYSQIVEWEKRKVSEILEKDLLEGEET